jgi:hypothetical protein
MAAAFLATFSCTVASLTVAAEVVLHLTLPHSPVPLLLHEVQLLILLNQCWCFLERFLRLLQMPCQISDRHPRYVEQCLDGNRDLLEARWQGAKYLHDDLTLLHHLTERGKVCHHAVQA